VWDASMTNKKPPFEITNANIGYVVEIAEVVDATSSDQFSSNPTLWPKPYLYND
jgi:hypothetical protein